MNSIALFSHIAVPLALGRHDRVSRPVGAVVVDGVLLSDPRKAPVLDTVEVLELLLVPPPLALRGAKLGLDRGLAAVDVEALVGRDERGLAPIRLLEPASRGPIVGVP